MNPLFYFHSNYRHHEVGIIDFDLIQQNLLRYPKQLFVNFEFFLLHVFVVVLILLILWHNYCLLNNHPMSINPYVDDAFFVSNDDDEDVRDNDCDDVDDDDHNVDMMMTFKKKFFLIKMDFFDFL